MRARMTVTLGFLDCGFYNYMFPSLMASSILIPLDTAFGEAAIQITTFNQKGYIKVQ